MSFPDLEVPCFYFSTKTLPHLTQNQENMTYDEVCLPSHRSPLFANNKRFSSKEYTAVQEFYPRLMRVKQRRAKEYKYALTQTNATSPHQLDQFPPPTHAPFSQ